MSDEDLQAEIERLRKDQEDEIRIIRDTALGKLRDEVAGKIAANRVSDERKKIEWLRAGDTITTEILDQIPQRRWRDIQVTDAKMQEKIDRALARGLDRAGVMARRGSIVDACLTLQGETRVLGRALVSAA